MMKINLTYVLIFSAMLSFGQNPVTDGSDWTVSNITPDNTLDYPNTIIYGPDGELWITEREGKQVVKIDKTSGAKSVLLDLSAEVHQSKGQDGLMGMAIHPDLYADITTSSNNYIYLAYTYDIDPSDDNDDNTEGDVDRRLIIERYDYNYTNDILEPSSATTIIDGLDASNDHNSGKLIIGPDLKLYYSIGDQGANQFSNACDPIQSQDLPTSTTDFDAYKGKILRLNLDGSIPNDNPLLNGVRSHVFSYGHRNAQGIVFGSNGKLYASEHGGKVDDEINIIEAGKNYGWPEISGGFDNYGFTYCDWSSTPGGCTGSGFSNHNCAPGVTPMTESMSYPSGAPSDFVGPIGTYGSTITTEPTGGWLTWPTVAPAGISIYEGGLIPDWGESLLIPTLKRGTIYRVKLNATGDGIDSNPTLLDGSVYEEFHSSNDRYRDVAVDPDGITLYAITDNTGGTSGPSGTSSVSIENPGVVMKIQFTGQTLSTTSQDLTDIGIYPNPTKDTFHFKSKGFDSLEDLRVTIIDMQGRLTKSVTLSNLNDAVDISELVEGVYAVSLSSSKQPLFKHLIVKK
ncbi:MAG: PQQ-dependent sugar dehydrogenase [Bacteroidota bacterium]